MEFIILYFTEIEEQLKDLMSDCNEFRMVVCCLYIGSPGVGKTTLNHVLQSTVNVPFLGERAIPYEFNAMLANFLQCFIGKIVCQNQSSKQQVPPVVLLEVSKILDMRHISPICTEFHHSQVNAQQNPIISQKELIPSIDVGGQPTFLEILPALSTGSAMYLVLIRALCKENEFSQDKHLENTTLKKVFVDGYSCTLKKVFDGYNCTSNLSGNHSEIENSNIGSISNIIGGFLSICPQLHRQKLKFLNLICKDNNQVISLNKHAKILHILQRNCRILDQDTAFICPCLQENNLLPIDTVLMRNMPVTSFCVINEYSQDIWLGKVFLGYI